MEQDATIAAAPSSLLPRAVLCAWFDLAVTDQEDVCNWHDREHLPERLGLPGFLCGRRFIAMEGAPEYLIVYDIDTLGSLAAEPYLARLNAPTRWTTASLGKFRNSIRSAAVLQRSHARGLGGFTLALRLEAADPASMVDRLLPILATIEQLPGIVAVRLAQSDQDLSAKRTQERRLIPGGVVAADWIMLIEATSSRVLVDVATRHLSTEWLLQNAAVEAADTGIYQMQICHMAH